MQTRRGCGLALIDAPAPSSERSRQGQKPQPDSFAARYPNLADWIKDGHIEIGRNGCSASTIRLFHKDNLMWEGGTRYGTIDGMLEEAEEAAKEF